MTQGDYVKINSTNEMELKLKHLEARIREWDYQTALTIKLEPHRDPSSLSQDALFNIWCSVRLSVPRNSEYVRVRQNELEKESKQKAKEETNHTAGSGKGSSATAKTRSSKGEQQLGLL